MQTGMVSANYIRTLNIDEPLARVKSDGTVRHYQQDALGSVIALTDETGAIKTQYVYDPFGNTSFTGEQSDQPFQFAGRENDGTGLYYYRFRYYSAALQRFISEDPVGLAGGLNFYMYAVDNPLLFIDPSGLESSTLGRNINVGPKAKDYTGTVADLYNEVRGYVNARFGIKAMNDADKAIFELRKTIDYKQTRNITILYGTQPIRFIGLAKPGEELVLNPDVIKWPTTIKGLGGLPKLDIPSAAIDGGRKCR